LVFALLVPSEATEEHLGILASLAELFSDADMRQRLRLATSAEQLRQLIAAWDPTPNTSRNASAR
jgi:PTS system nitrogen regulatory IIA component